MPNEDVTQLRLILARAWHWSMSGTYMATYNQSQYNEIRHLIEKLEEELNDHKICTAYHCMGLVVPDPEQTEEMGYDVSVCDQCETKYE